ncbi:PX domain-containing protein EREL1 isoform X2 [Amborella trichopoda]|uniref:PX domain-containing protein EREL1 isoform X2 n=1 Tax=Amborella trichopoda TaxID=13333 RepID=UPI0005D44966|nr:PX domain-containing protein EREL1 isoform X2 [Amborella trichopoda]|eukprot:XP_011621232.1 PX domain-containing protein EREL1 isoform X2 [Amborella trichopoda]
MDRHFKREKHDQIPNVDQQEGRVAFWLHDPESGWSYSVTIPSTTVQPKSRAIDGSLINPIVFYRVQVAIESPQGVSTTRSILRRFSDFLKLFTTLKRVFPQKNLPPAPPKHAFLRINSSRQHIEERRAALEEWLNKLLYDNELSRSVSMASFLELEAAAWSFQDASQAQQSLELNTTSSKFRPCPGASVGESSSVASGALSVTPDYGSDNTCETSDIGTPRQGRNHGVDVGFDDLTIDKDITAPLATYNLGETMEYLPVTEGEALRHARKLSIESDPSDVCSLKGSERSNMGVTNSMSDQAELHGAVEKLSTSEDYNSCVSQLLSDIQIALPMDQRQKMNRVVISMQRRLNTVKTDMEDLIARLNQEIAVKEYLMTKVKDLDGELETTKQKSKENLQNAVLIERERLTQLQWDMEELRRKYLEMESKLNSVQDEKIHTETANQTASREKEQMQHELDNMRDQLKNLEKDHRELELKAKTDTKVLVKEVKSLRKSQTELKQDLQQSLQAKTELERLLQEERQKREFARAARAKLLHECGILCRRLQDCSINILTEDEDRFAVEFSSRTDVFDQLATSDNRIGLLLAEAQLLAQEDENDALQKVDSNEFRANLQVNGSDSKAVEPRDLQWANDDETTVRKMLTDVLIDNAQLRKVINSVIRCAVKTVPKPEKEETDEVPSRKSVLNKFLER